MSLLTDVAGRFDATVTYFTQMSLVWVQVAAARPNRIALGFSTQGTNVSTLTITPADFNSGLPIYQNNNITWILVKDHGPLCQMPWYWLNSSSPASLAVWEVTDLRG